MKNIMEMRPKEAERLASLDPTLLNAGAMEIADFRCLLSLACEEN